jgi:hypothetical protein
MMYLSTACLDSVFKGYRIVCLNKEIDPHCTFECLHWSHEVRIGPEGGSGEGDVWGDRYESLPPAASMAD